MGYPMLDAAVRGDVETLARWLDQEANADAVLPGAGAWTALLHAAFRGHRAVVQLLLDRGATADYAGARRHTALTLAAGQGHWDVARLLAAYGADVHWRDGTGHSAMDYARQQKQRHFPGSATSLHLSGSRP